MIDPARSFDRAAEEYEATRPSYPDEVLDLLPVATDTTVLDLGAGTGKLTRVLAARYARVIAVEPLDGMRGILERVVPGVEALPGTAEQIPLEDASVDAVFTAQAFHWFDHKEALPEIGRVLRPGGVLAVVWNGPDESRPNPLPPAYLEYLRELRRERSTLDERTPFRDLIAYGPFGEVHEEAVPHDHVLDRAGHLGNARSVSWIATRDPDEVERVIARLGDLLPEEEYAVPNLANVLWAIRS
ncbi:MAG: class I SAM-dependent methyltransferase [Gaiellaceae bacterium]